MHVIGQHYPTVDVKGALGSRLAHGFTQGINPLNKKLTAPFQQIDGEEKRATWHAIAAVVGHGRILALQRLHSAQGANAFPYMDSSRFASQLCC